MNHVVDFITNEQLRASYRRLQRARKERRRALEALADALDTGERRDARRLQKRVCALDDEIDDRLYSLEGLRRLQLQTRGVASDCVVIEWSANPTAPAKVRAVVEKTA